MVLRPKQENGISAAVAEGTLAAGEASAAHDEPISDGSPAGEGAPATEGMEITGEEEDGPLVD